MEDSPGKEIGSKNAMAVPNLSLTVPWVSARIGFGFIQPPIGAMSLTLLWDTKESPEFDGFPKTWLLLIRQTLGTDRKSQKSITAQDSDHLLNTYCVPGTMLFALSVLSGSITVNNPERFLQILFAGEETETKEVNATCPRSQELGHMESAFRPRWCLKNHVRSRFKGTVPKSRVEVQL